MWIPDLDCCRPMSTDEARVDRACKALFKNNSFYHRPESDEEADQQLWTVFKDRLVQTRLGMFKTESEDKSSLAGRLMSKVEEKGTGIGTIFYSTGKSLAVNLYQYEH